MNLKKYIEYLSNRPVLLYAILFIIICLLRIPTLFYHLFDPDEAIFANAGRILLDGGTIYDSYIDHKPPMLYYMFAGMLSIVDDLRFVHFIAMIWMWATSLTIYHLCKHVFSQTAGVIAALCYSLFSSTLILSTSAEVLMNLPIVVGVYFFFKGIKKNTYKHYFFMAGIMIGSASLIKHQAGLAIIPMIIYSMINFKSFRFYGLLILSAGVGVSYIPWVLLAVVQGNLENMIQWGYLLNMSYLDKGPNISWWWEMLRQTVRAVVLAQVLLWVFSIKQIKQFIFNSDDHWKMKSSSPIFFGILWLGISIFSVIMGLRFYKHYFIQLAPPLVFLAASVLWQYIDRWESFSAKRKWVFLIFLIVPAISFMSYYSIKKYTKSSYHQSEVVEKIVDYLTRSTMPEDQFFLWGQYAGISYLSRRYDVSPFAHASLLLGNYDPCKIPDDYDVAVLGKNKYFNQLIEVLKQDPPKVIIDLQPQGFGCWGHFEMSKFPALKQFVDDNYVFDAAPGSAHAYQLKQ